MKKRIFIDEFTDIKLENGLVRVNYSNKTDQDSTEVTNELIMPPAAFLKSFSAMEDLVNKLIADGVIKKSNKSEEKKDEAISMPASPNFG